MSPIRRILIVLALIIAVAAVIFIKNAQFSGSASREEIPTAGTADGGQSAADQVTAENNTGPLPRLVDLGAGTCIPCKMMAPILEELTKEYAGEFEVVYINIREDAAVSEKYGLNVIPTQIFFDPKGKELFRHEGFFSKESILKKWKALGYNFAQNSSSRQGEGE